MLFASQRNSEFTKFVAMFFSFIRYFLARSRHNFFLSECNELHRHFFNTQTVVAVWLLASVDFVHLNREFIAKNVTSISYFYLMSFIRRTSAFVCMCVFVWVLANTQELLHTVHTLKNTFSHLFVHRIAGNLQYTFTGIHIFMLCRFLYRDSVFFRFVLFYFTFVRLFLFWAQQMIILHTIHANVYRTDFHGASDVKILFRHFCLSIVT